MKKKIYHATIHYKWRTIRYVKGVAKPSKTWKEEKYEHKSSNEIGVEVTNVVMINYLCMSRDVY